MSQTLWSQVGPNSLRIACRMFPCPRPGRARCGRCTNRHYQARHASGARRRRRRPAGRRARPEAGCGRHGSRWSLLGVRSLFPSVYARHMCTDITGGSSADNVCRMWHCFTRSAAIPRPRRPFRSPDGSLHHGERAPLQGGKDQFEAFGRKAQNIGSGQQGSIVSHDLRKQTLVGLLGGEKRAASKLRRAFSCPATTCMAE